MGENFKLISYCIPTDDGAAPNPFWDTCTLVICKPVIRRVTANIGDWIVGTGSKNVFDSSGRDYSGRIVYAMKVTDKMLMADYDERHKEKRPDLSSADERRRVGDSIYDFSSTPNHPKIRPGVHSEGNRQTDLGGMYALLSKHFYYFGSAAPDLPTKFRGIARQTQGHQYKPNDKDKVAFIRWLTEESDYPKNTIIGNPQRWPYLDEDCGRCRTMEDSEDERRAQTHQDDGC